jgi:hypothetical protein
MNVWKSLALTLGFAAAAFAQNATGITPTVEGSKFPRGINDARNQSIIYHGGPVMGTVPNSPVHLYFIYYGNWAGLDPTGEKIVNDFGAHLGGSGYWNILTSYVEPNGTAILNELKLAGITNDNYSQGKSLTDTTLQTVVKTAISNGSLPLDANGIYHVLTTQDVTETSGFCSSYCGFHNFMTYQSTNLKYTFVGNPAGCTQYGGVADCQGETTNITKSPNGNPGVDAMISVIAHESEEATSDPNLNAWYFNSGSENADMCAYTYGTTFPVANGSVANITLGGRNFLIQQNWIAPNKGCALTY